MLELFIYTNYISNITLIDFLCQYLLVAWITLTKMFLEEGVTA